MQAIAAENNLAETAFFVREGSDYALRWFTPAVEVDLCGHATLASGHVVFSFLEQAAGAAEEAVASGPQRAALYGRESDERGWSKAVGAGRLIAVRHSLFRGENPNATTGQDRVGSPR
jgi:predicted PhzF superfamily epimerase YddE/YHI9